MEARKMNSKLGKDYAERKSIKRKMLIDEVAVDIINGMDKKTCLDKLQLGIYESIEQPQLSVTTSYRIYNAAIEALKFNIQSEIDEKRAVLWSRYENLYRESLESGMHMNARACLSDMAKIFGLAEPEKREVSLDASKISFNFGSNV